MRNSKNSCEFEYSNMKVREAYDSDDELEEIRRRKMQELQRSAGDEQAAEEQRRRAEVEKASAGMRSSSRDRAKVIIRPMFPPKESKFSIVTAS